MSKPVLVPMREPWALQLALGPEVVPLARWGARGASLVSVLPEPHPCAPVQPEEQPAGARERVEASKASRKERRQRAQEKPE